MPEGQMSQVPFQPTPSAVVSAMLDLAGVTARDVVIDLGSGDGRILITAAQSRRARGIGYDIDPRRTNEAWKSARRHGVSGVRFVTGDIFDADLSTATVVMLFLWPHVNLTLRPKLQRELRPGARVVSFYWDMGDWPPDRTLALPDGPVFLWTVRPGR